MRYFNFLVQEFKKAKESVQKIRENPPKTFMSPVERQWREFETNRFMQLYHEYESYAPDKLKLILMDAQQALVFSEKENPEDHWQEVIKAPFSHFFLEFSEPIALNAPEPLNLDNADIFGTNDFVHAICYKSLTQEEISSEALFKPYKLDSSTVKDDEYAFITLLCQTNGHGWRKEQHTIDGKTANVRDTGLDQLKIMSPGLGGTMLGVMSNEFGESGKKKFEELARNYNLQNPSTKQANATTVQRITRSFLYHVKTGTVIARIEAIKDYFEDPSQLPKDYPFNTITAGDSLGIENRYIGWWERSLLIYSSLTSWILLYLMAKGIEIVEEPLSRSEKRRKEHESKKDEKEETTYPNDWHIIQSKPRFSNGSSNGNGSGKPHRFRYDVMGHLRNGRHQLKDGTWKLTLEWVPAHQRGLNNSLYIPAIRKAEVNKKSDERNYEYFRKPGELP
jgi:hypothetical protein